MDRQDTMKAIMNFFFISGSSYRLMITGVPIAISDQNHRRMCGRYQCLRRFSSDARKLLNRNGYPLITS